jgi:hypothetical protein
MIYISCLEDFSTLCVVRADLSPLRGSAQLKKGPAGNGYWRIVFSIEIHFGLTEFKARLKWVEDVSILLSFVCVVSEMCFFLPFLQGKAK